MTFTKGNPHASAGGKARAAALTPAQRKIIAAMGGKAFIAQLAAKHFDGDLTRARKYMRDWLAYLNDPYDNPINKSPYPGGPMPRKGNRK